jgi:hypothetical protein
MDDILNFFPSPTSRDPLTLLLSLTLAYVLGQIIGWIYMGTHTSPSYSRSFVASLVSLPVIVALMMLLMAGSTAIAFGLLAVFAVVRFRNVLKDTRDTTYILWAIVEGMGAGTFKYTETLMGLFAIGGVLLYLRWSDFGSRLGFDTVLSVEAGSDSGTWSDRVEAVLGRYASRWDRSEEQQLTADTNTVTYRLWLRDPERSHELRRDLLACENVERISLYTYDDSSQVSP